MNHKYSTIFILILFVLASFIFVFGIDSEDVDELCSQDNSTLWRANGAWNCATFQNGTLNVNSTIYVLANASNNSMFLGGHPSTDFVLKTGDTMTGGITYSNAINNPYEIDSIRDFWAFKYADGLGIDGTGMYFNAGSGWLSLLTYLGTDLLHITTGGDLSVYRDLIIGNGQTSDSYSMQVKTSSLSQSLSYTGSTDTWDFTGTQLIIPNLLTFSNSQSYISRDPATAEMNFYAINGITLNASTILLNTTKATVDGDLQINGNLIYNNNITTKSIIPLTNNSFDLGNKTNYWRNIYGTYFIGDGSQLTNISSGSGIANYNNIAMTNQSNEYTYDIIYPISVSQAGFKPDHSTTGYTYINGAFTMLISSGIDVASEKLQLPDKSRLINATCYANQTTTTWGITRVPIGSSEALAQLSANFNTTDTSLTGSSLITNSNYSYHISVNAGKIYGCIIWINATESSTLG